MPHRVALLGPGDFLGEGCLSGLPLRVEAAVAITPTTVQIIGKHEMTRVLHKESTLSDRFISYLLARHVQIDEGLLNLLFNSVEKRLARTLLLLARYSNKGFPPKRLAKVSQFTLAEMVGTPRGRINYFMNKFKRLGLIDYNGEIEIHESLLNHFLYQQDTR